MDGYPQVIFMPVSLRKILIPIFIISGLLIFFISGGANYLGKQLASLSGVITAWVTINPLEVEVSAPSQVELNNPFQVRAEIINKGGERIKNVRAEIVLPAGLVLFPKEAVQEIKFIPGNQTRKVSWRVVGEEEENYVILVLVSAELKGELISAEDSAMIEVKESLPRGWSRLQSVFDFFQNWFRF